MYERLKFLIAIILAIIMVIIFSLPVYAYEDNLFNDGYTSENTLVYSYPYSDETINMIEQNVHIFYNPYDEAYSQIIYSADGATGYIKNTDINSSIINSVEYDVPNYSGKKSYMGYNFSSNTKQDVLQSFAITNSDGFRMVDGRYCVALGTYFSEDIGKYFDIVLENGEIIKCILGDVKADAHTDPMNIFSLNNCCTEFIIDPDALNDDVKYHGDCSHLKPEWNSRVIKIIAYDKNIFS
jgi:hypothetical protein